MFEGRVVAGRHVLQFGGVTHVMGVLNVSPESRNPHTIATTPEAALALAGRYREWGAGIIDVGAQSSHYEAPSIDDETEIARLTPIVEALADAGFLVSVDTWKTSVATAAVEAGAVMVNDTGGLRAREMVELVEQTNVAAVAVHVDGVNPHAVNEVSGDADKARTTAERFGALIDGLPPAVVERLILDPGIAINYRGDYAAYTSLQIQVIRSSSVFASLRRPLLLPIPRKREIGRVAAYVTLALEYDADIIRVHDVALAADLVRLFDREAHD